MSTGLAHTVGNDAGVKYEHVSIRKFSVSGRANENPACYSINPASMYRPDNTLSPKLAGIDLHTIVNQQPQKPT